MLIDTWRHDCGRQAPLTPTSHLRVSKECSQGSGVEADAGSATTIRIRFLCDRLVDLSDRKVSQLCIG
jgi:hypothetical protein